MTFRYSLVVTGMLFSLLFLSSCEDSTGPEETDATGFGVLSLSLDKSAAPAEVAAVRGFFHRVGHDTVTFELMIAGSTASKKIEDVAVGTWGCRIEAMNSAEEVIYMGETDVTVRAGETTNVDITLTPVSGDILITVNWGDTAPESDTYFLVLDEDVLDNGQHFNNAGGPITPSGPQFFSAMDVNDSLAYEKQRLTLHYFQEQIGRTITVKSGQTSDEGWFALNCVPARWISGNSAEDNTCLTGSDRQTALKNYAGINGTGAIPDQDRLDKIPDVRPLRALGLNNLIDKVVYAVVYDSDISINYDHDSLLGVNGNLQGATLGTVVFRVNEVRTLNNFSDSTLPEVQITILDVVMYEDVEMMLFDAPVPESSSVPNDRIAPGSTDGYYAL